jgi:small subunit ribosomal protein S3Ae
VKQVEGSEAGTIFKGHEHIRDYLRSFVRRRSSKIDSIFDIVTKDGYKLRISAMAISTSDLKTSQEKAVRKVVRETIKERARALTFDEFVNEMVMGDLNSSIYSRAKKIAPLRHTTISKSKLLASP